MNFIKSPQQLLLEQAGDIPASPGLMQTPRQMLLGSTGMSPQDMLAELLVNNQEPQHFRDGGHSLHNALRSTKINLARKPGQSFFNALGFLDVLNQAYDSAQAAREGKPVQAFEKGFNAVSAIPVAMPSQPATVSLAVPYGGQVLTEQTANYLAQHPEFRQQLSEMSESPLGGALGGDAALAAQILGNRDYSDVLESRLPQEEPQPEPEKEKIKSLLHRMTMGTNR